MREVPQYSEWIHHLIAWLAEGLTQLRKYGEVCAYLGVSLL